MVVDQLRQPAYTGENRCTPCTVVNMGLAVGLAGVVAVAWSRAVGPGWPLAGGSVLALALAVIWLRGYLVPGTPTLTKRYFPDRVLAWFDKEPGATAVAEESTADGPHGDPETLLLEAGVVEPCVDADDLCLDDSFRSAWDDRMDRLATAEARRRAVADRLGIDSDGFGFEERHNGLAVVADGGRTLAEWPSEATAVADLAADDALTDWVDGWETLGEQTRSGVVGGLRAFLDDCPTCGGPIEMGTDTVESCCRTHEVIAVRCGDCSARLLEVPAEAATESEAA